MTPGRSASGFHFRPSSWGGAELKTRATAGPGRTGKEKGKSMKIEIFSTTGSPLYCGEHENLAAALTAAAFTGADLRGANLARADLANADLSGEDGK